MYKLSQREIQEIKKGGRNLGLEISDSEICDIEMGKPISLQDRTISELGSAFILASAISASKLGKKINITLEKLPYLRLPIHSYDSESLGKCCLFLTLINGSPEIIIGSEKLAEQGNNTLCPAIAND